MNPDDGHERPRNDIIATVCAHMRSLWIGWDVLGGFCNALPWHAVACILQPPHANTRTLGSGPLGRVSSPHN